MKFTTEQEAIIASNENIKINAVAGSGKTTTVIEYAKSRDVKSRILYLAFNKSVKLDAIKKFNERNVTNVRVETAHSLAYKAVLSKYHYKVKIQGYQIHEIAELLNINNSGEKHNEFILANHILKFMSCYCNSDKQKISDVNYIETISDKKARTFVRNNEKLIRAGVVAFWELMSSGRIEITHDFYLKKYQLSNPVLHYDYILFDEGQDASPAMLDVFLKQKTTKVIVGDTHQQIYGWRYAVNSLEKTDFKCHFLSTSFRFPQSIADLANEVLKLKQHINTYEQLKIIGGGNGQGSKSKAIIARTNLGLLMRAIEYVFEENKQIRHIYFEGNIHSYTYADEGASLYDVLNLYNSKRFLIKDKLIKSMSNMIELEEYIEKTEDLQLGMMVKIVKAYENKIPAILKTLKEMHVSNDQKEMAEIVFSTVHRCKGIEYDDIELVDDFITEEQIKKLIDSKDRALMISKINEEINLLYVAVTRTRNILKIPEPLVPKGFPKYENIITLQQEAETEEVQEVGINEPASTENQVQEKAYSVEEIRKTHFEAYQPWSPELDLELTQLAGLGIKTKIMAQYFGRTPGAIRSRIKKLELENLVNN